MNIEEKIKKNLAELLELFTPTIHVEDSKDRVILTIDDNYHIIKKPNQIVDSNVSYI